LPVFALAREACERDGGSLWGRSLCGPILLVDPATRELVANQPDGEGRLVAQSGAFVGTLPVEVSPANTALDWSGTRWSLLLWPLPAEPVEQARLLLHESFHRIQGDLRLPANTPANLHLDSEVGRIWLQLEWRALLFAHETPANRGRKEALVDALAFRARRFELFPEGRPDEIALEKNEGLAEYTGIVLGGAETARRQVIENLRRAPSQPSFVRSFAYATGPAYGLVLDSLRPRWRREIATGPVDLGRLLSLSLGLTAEEWRGLAATAEERAQGYDGARLIATEHDRALTRAAERAELRSRLVDGPVLRLGFDEMSIAFDPGELVPLEGAGTVYPGARITDTWGVLTVERGGALVAADWSAVTVPAGKKPRLRAGVLHGDGWTLALAPGWRLIKVAKTRERPVRGWTVARER
jgi:hypothetical protein